MGLPGCYAPDPDCPRGNLWSSRWPPGSKSLTGREGYQVRVGDYRILYTVDRGELLVCVIEIGNRRDIYR